MRASLHGFGSRREIQIVIDLEGAEYIADVMDDEWLRKRDSGAREIAAEIRAALPVDDEATS